MRVIGWAAFLVIFLLFVWLIYDVTRMEDHGERVCLAAGYHVMYTRFGIYCQRLENGTEVIRPWQELENR